MDLSKEPIEDDDPSITQMKQSKAKISSPETIDVKENSDNKGQKKYNLRSNAKESLELQVPTTSALRMDLSKEPIEDDDPSITQMKQSKAKISSPDPNDAKGNPGNKRQKKYNLRSYAKKSLELQVPTTSEPCTPIHNFTSSNTRTRHSTARQINVDIRDAIYKLPFEHGWKRELVYRKLSQPNRNSDVYYYSPTNRKLRSFREIQEQLDILSDNDLTTESFTFSKQPIGMNDQSKELVRDAYSKLSKEKSFVGVAVGPKKSKIPVQQLPFNYKLSDDENNKSSSTMKTVLKNDKRSSRLRSKNVSSLDPNDAKGNPGNKRQKKYNLRSNAKESLELQVPTTSELCTPIHNFTSSNTRTRHSTDRQINVDIRDAIYKLPFEHGWKRELVYRNLGQSNRNGDVYYYSPTNRKLRSLQEIQEQLDLLSDNDLTTESFTFLTQPIGINDQSKERVRDAYSTLSKEESFVGVAVGPKKSKIPVRQLPFDYKFSDDENNKSSSTMKIVLKNGKRSSRLRSKNVSSPECNDVEKNRGIKRQKKYNLRSNAKESLELQVPTTSGISESMNTSLSTLENISEDCQAIQSSASPIISSPTIKNIDINNTIVTRRNFEMNGSLRENVTPFVSMQSLNDRVKALGLIFKYLETHDLLSASRVCTSWRLIAMDKYLWQSVRLKNSMVYDWERFVDSIYQQRTDTLDTRNMSIPLKVEDIESFWLRFANAMKRAQQLKFIELYRCPVLVVEEIIHSLPQIEVLNATSIKKSMKEEEDPNCLMYLNLNNLGQMTKLTELRLKGLTGIKLTALPSFEHLIHLNSFSLTSIKAFPKEIYQSLNTITDNIEFFEIGDCEYLTKDLAVSLKRFVNLKTLRLENCFKEWNKSVYDVFTVIRGLEKLNVLELVNIVFRDSVDEELGKCDGIKRLLIIPSYEIAAANTNRNLIDCLKKLSKTLTHLVLGFTIRILKVTDKFIQESIAERKALIYNLEPCHTKETVNNLPVSRTRESLPNDENIDRSGSVDILSIPALEKLLDTMMPDVKTKIIKVPSSEIGRVHLSEQFK